MAADGLPPGEKPHIKVSSKLKEVIRRHCENCELRLREEQKKLAQQRRVSKAQESIMSEDEKKKRRKMRKVSGLQNYCTHPVALFCYCENQITLLVSRPSFLYFYAGGR